MINFLLGMLVMYIFMGVLASLLFDISYKYHIDTERLFITFHYPWVWVTIVPILIIIKFIKDKLGIK